VKYRQRGYQDKREETAKQPQADKPARKDNTFGPRAIQMPGRRVVSRCSQCGTQLQEQNDPAATCPKCGFELHSCKQCTHFDTSSRFDCTEPITQRIFPKDKRNECTFYSMRVSVEKETTSPAAAKPMDARQAFENLFKK
jgi:predicted RNA-binding Zn-ribbon protein involved in translation (DUF1610 family)